MRIEYAHARAALGVMECSHVPTQNGVPCCHVNGTGASNTRAACSAPWPSTGSAAAGWQLGLPGCKEAQLVPQQVDDESAHGELPGAQRGSSLQANVHCLSALVQSCQSIVLTCSTDNVPR